MLQSCVSQLCDLFNSVYILPRFEENIYFRLHRVIKTLQKFEIFFVFVKLLSEILVAERTSFFLKKVEKCLETFSIPCS